MSTEIICHEPAQPGPGDEQQVCAQCGQPTAARQEECTPPLNDLAAIDIYAVPRPSDG